MPRPKIPEFWRQRIRQIVANDPQGRKSAAQVRIQLEAIARQTGAGGLHPVPSERTIGRYLQEFRKSPPATLAPYRDYSWPRSHLGEGALPWEVAAAACELAVELTPGRELLGMTNAEALWYHRLRLAIRGDLLPDEFERIGRLAQLIAAREEAAPVEDDPDACTWLTLYIGLPKTEATYVIARKHWAYLMGGHREEDGMFPPRPPRLEHLIFLAPEVRLAHDLVGALAMYFVGNPEDIDLRRLPWSRDDFPSPLHTPLLSRLIEAPDDVLRLVQERGGPIAAHLVELARDLRDGRQTEDSRVMARLLWDPDSMALECFPITSKSFEIVRLLAEADRAHGRAEAKRLLLEHVTDAIRAAAKQALSAPPAEEAFDDEALQEWNGLPLGDQADGEGEGDAEEA